MLHEEENDLHQTILSQYTKINFLDVPVVWESRVIVFE